MCLTSARHIKLSSEGGCVGMSGVYRRPFLPSSFSPASSSGFTLGTYVLAVGLAMEPYVTLARSSRRPSKMSLRSPIGETSLSALSFARRFVVYDTEYVWNALRLKDFFLGGYCLSNAVAHQNFFSSAATKAKVLSSRLIKPTRQKNKKCK